MTVLEAVTPIKEKVSQKTFDLTRTIVGNIFVDRDEEFETEVNLDNLGIPREEQPYVLEAVDNAFMLEYEIVNGVLKNIE